MNKVDIKKKIETTDKLDKVKSIVSAISNLIGPAADAVVPGSSVALSVTGTAFSEIIGTYVGKKQGEILLQIIEDLEKLKQQVKEFDMKNLYSDERFASTVLRVLPLALRNTEKEKMHALRSVVLNTALGNTPDEDLRLIFLNYVDSLTASHLKILIYLRHPQGWFQQRKREIREISSVGEGLEIAYPEFVGKREFYVQIVDDLILKGLLYKGQYMTGISMTSSGSYDSRTTEFGNKFIAFITVPIEIDE